MTQGVNIRRGKPQNVTHCPVGHAYTTENTRLRVRQRVSRAGTPYTSTERECQACYLRRARAGKKVA